MPPGLHTRRQVRTSNTRRYLLRRDEGDRGTKVNTSRTPSCCTSKQETRNAHPDLTPRRPRRAESTAPASLWFLTATKRKLPGCLSGASACWRGTAIWSRAGGRRSSSPEGAWGRTMAPSTTRPSCASDSTRRGRDRGRRRRGSRLIWGPSWGWSLGSPSRW